MSALLAGALYSSAEVATRYAESTGLVTLAEQLDLVKPAYTWGITMFLLHGYSPFTAKTIAMAELVGTLLSGAATNKNTVLRRYAAFPAVASVVAIAASMLISGYVAVPGSTVAFVVALHMASIVHELIWRMTLPAPVIAAFQPLSHLQQRHASRSNVHMLRIPSTASPNTHLSGVLVRPKVTQFGRPPRVLLYLGGNGELWEHSVMSIEELAGRLGATAVLFNYRGVGSSGGVTRRCEGMATDASDVIKYLLKTEEGLLESDILIFGHSIGGGVAAEVVSSTHPQCSVVLDRTFSSLPDAAKGLFTRIPLPLITSAMSASFGVMDSAAAWPKIAHARKLVTYHRSDRVISFDCGSLGRLPGFQSGADKQYVVELRGQANDAHNCDVSEFDGSAEVFRRMAAFYRP